jgi:hypothetical protein
LFLLDDSPARFFNEAIEIYFNVSLLKWGQLERSALISTQIAGSRQKVTEWPRFISQLNLAQAQSQGRRVVSLI